MLIVQNRVEYRRSQFFGTGGRYLSVKILLGYCHQMPQFLHIPVLDTGHRLLHNLGVVLSQRFMHRSLPIILRKGITFIQIRENLYRILGGF